MHYACSLLFHFSLRAYDVLESLCGLLGRVMLDERVRRPLATGENFRVLTAMTNVSCLAIDMLVYYVDGHIIFRRFLPLAGVKFPVCVCVCCVRVWLLVWVFCQAVWGAVCALGRVQ